MEKEDELMVVMMKAAVDLVQTYNSGLSVDALRARMNRVADDLKHAANDYLIEHIRTDDD